MITFLGEQRPGPRLAVGPERDRSLPSSHKALAPLWLDAFISLCLGRMLRSKVTGGRVTEQTLLASCFCGHLLVPWGFWLRRVQVGQSWAGSRPVAFAFGQSCKDNPGVAVLPAAVLLPQVSGVPISLLVPGWGAT